MRRDSIKSTFGVFVAVAIAALAIGCGSDDDGGEAAGGTEQNTPSVSWRLAGFGQADSYWDQGSKQLADEVSERTNGKFKIQVFPAQQLYPGAEIMRNVSRGLVQMGEAPSNIYADTLPLAAAAALPFFINSIDDVKTVYSDPEIAKQVEAEFAKQGVTPVALSAYGSTGFTSRKPLTRLEELKGLQVSASSGPVQKTMELYGAVPVQIGNVEVYEALQRGTVDLDTGAPSSAVLNKYYEVAKHYLNAQLYASSDYWFVNSDEYNKLPDSYKTALQEAGDVVTAKQFELAKAEHEKNLATLRQEMDVVTDLPEADQVAAAQKTAHLIDEWAKEKGAEDFAARVRTLVQ
jgi:TRAP-type transport system periplasmic protein